MRQLPREVTPPLGLWPRIAARLPAREPSRLGTLIAELPAAIEPPAAVWAGVAARIGAARALRRRAGRYLGAAVLLAAVAVSIVAIGHRRSVGTAPDGPLTAAADSEGRAPGALGADLSAAGAADDVAAALQRTSALVQAERAAIEQAIAAAPADAHLRELWAHAYETELELNDLYGRTIMTYRQGSGI